MKIGVMGCGVVADYGHIPAIRSTPGLELEAIFDPNPSRLKSEAAKFGIDKAYTDQEEFLESGIDAVVISSPVPHHLENFRGAAERGLHVLCEKPLGMNDQEAQQMIDLADQAKIMLCVGFVYRFSPVAQQLKRWVEEDVVGEIRSLRLVYSWDLHGQYEQNESGEWIEAPRYIGRMEEGGPLVDCGVHQIDLARWWLNQDVTSFSSSGAWVTDYEAPDHVYLNMDHANGAHSMIEVSFSYGHTARHPSPIFTYDLIGTGGFLRYDRDGYILEAHTGQDTIRVPGASEKNFAGMYQAFEQVLRSGEPGDFPQGRDGLIATQIARKATDQLIDSRKRKLSIA